MSYVDPKNRLRKSLSPSNAVEAADRSDAAVADSVALPPLRPRRQRSLAMRAIRASGFAFIAFVLMVSGWFLELWGVVTTMEFSPDTFRHRSSWYIACLFVPVSPPIRHEIEFPLDKYLREKGYVTSTSETRWDFVKGFHPGLRGWSGSAKSFCKGVGCWGGAGEERIQWSEQHPELADVVWPQVVSWARNEQYESVFYLFHSPKFSKAKTPDDIRALIDEVDEVLGEYGRRDSR